MGDFVYGAGWHRREMLRNELWTPDFAAARYRGEHYDPKNLASGAIVTQLGEGLATLSYSYGFNNFQVSFPNVHGQHALWFGYQSPVRRQGEEFRGWSDEEVAARSGQMLLSSIDVRYLDVAGQLLRTATVSIKPSGRARRGERPYSQGSMGNKTVVEQDPWPGLDVESCWVPFPEFGEWGPLFEPLRPELEVFDIEVPPLKILAEG